MNGKKAKVARKVAKHISGFDKLDDPTARKVYKTAKKQFKSGGYKAYRQGKINKLGKENHE